MHTDITVTTGKRKASKRGSIESLKNRIAQKYPDPVLAFRRLSDKKSVAKSKQPTLDEAYDSFNVIRPSFSMAVMMKLPDLDPYLSGALDAVATAVSASKMEIVYTGKGEGSEKELQDLNTFFFESNDPTNPMSLQEKIRVATLDFLILGSWNFEITQLDTNFIDLVHAPAEFIRVKRDFTGYKMIKNSDVVEFDLYGTTVKTDVNQILRAIFKKPGHRVYGKPLIYPLVDTILMNSLRNEKNLQWFSQGTLADIILLLENNLDLAVRQQVIADYQNTGAGEQAMYILEGVGKGAVEQIKRELEAGSVTELEGHNRQRVLSCLRVPPAKVAIFEDANRANSLTQDEVFRNEVLLPLQVTFKTRFNHIIKNHFKFADWEFTMTPQAPRDQLVESKVNVEYMSKGVYTINDVLRLLGYDTVQFGDRHLLWTTQGVIDLETGMNLGQANLPTDNEPTELFVDKLVRLRDKIQERLRGEHAGCH